jgi:hypothetical protein
VEKIKLEEADQFCLNVTVNVLYCADARVLNRIVLQGQRDLEFGSRIWKSENHCNNFLLSTSVVDMHYCWVLAIDFAKTLIDARGLKR